MPGNARAWDLWSGVCCCHPPHPCIGMSGLIIQYSNNVFVNNRNQARHFDLTIGFCGHIGFISTASQNTFCNNKGVARGSDLVSGCNVGSIITQSPDVFTNS
jgi:hypothetical protein